MLRNYFKTAFRNLFRNRRHSMLNIIGLAVALAACMIVFLVIQYENSYDRHLNNYDHIYQIVTRGKDADGEHFSGGVPFPATRFLRQDFSPFPFAELMQVYGVQVSLIRKEGENTKFREERGVFYGDPELMKMFEIKFLAGNADALKDLNGSVISKSLAEKYFGNWKDAMGKTLNIDNADHNFQVAGVFEDVPENSDFPFTLVGSYEGFKAFDRTLPFNEWGANTSNHQVYVALPAQANTNAIDRQLAAFEKKYRSGNNRNTRTHFLQPLKNIHFDERFETNGDHVTSKASLYTLSFIGLLVILMACINFVNLSTALAVTRSKEVGIRKVMGSSKLQLSMQVMAETATIVSVSAVLGMALCYFALPYVKNIMIVQSRLNLFNTGSLLFILITIILTVLVSGLYPAMIMSRFNPVEAIKNSINTSRIGNVSLRRLLVVLQFAFSQILIIATIIAVSQMRFIKNSDLGFTKEAVLMVYMNADSLTQSRHQAFKDALKARNDVRELSFAFDAPSSDNSWLSNFAFDRMEDRNFNVQLKQSDDNYAHTYGLQLLAGRFYGPSDTCREYVVNETLIRKCGFKNPQDAIGKMFRLGGKKPMAVVGVVKDFKQASLRDAVQPLVIFPNKRFYQCVGIQLHSGNLSKTSQEIKNLWDKYFPEYVYHASFLNDNINRYYQNEQRLSTMYKVYALLAIFISCLGLYGMVSFMVIQKSKEVGIRKVLGASVQSILYLFSREFTLLISISFLIAAPVAWYLMNGWLKAFAYKIEIGAGVFLAAFTASLLIAWITVGYKAMRTATANPVKSLRTE